MRLLWGITSLSLIWSLCGPLSGAEKDAPAPPAFWRKPIVGIGDTEEAAKKDAIYYRDRAGRVRTGRAGHGDHSGTASFVAASMDSVSRLPDGKTHGGSASLGYFIIHRGRWPVPSGLFTDMPLLAPPEMTRLDTEWKSVPLTRDEVALKAKSLPVDVALEVRSMLSLPLVGVTVFHPAGASIRMT